MYLIIGFAICFGIILFNNEQRPCQHADPVGYVIHIVWNGSVFLVTAAIIAATIYKMI